jgi:predicted acetyltransferase
MSDVLLSISFHAMDLDMRSITEDEVNPFRSRLVQAFGDDLSAEDKEETLRHFLDRTPLERTRAVFDGDQIVGTLACYPLSLAVPGGELAMGGTTMVTVQPTHRRRGLLREMMLSHLHDVKEAGEPLAGLWASESSIYGRFGYGPASDRFEVDLDAATVHFVGEPAGGRISLVEADAAAAVLPGIYDRVRSTRPGMIDRSEAWWKWTVFYDPPRWRQGKSASRFAIHTGPDGVDGYVIYRQKEKWEGFLSTGKISIKELIAATSEAHEGLWRFVTNIDLFPNVHYWNQPVDDELGWRITDPRRVTRRRWDALWLRILDVPAALGGRAYPVEGILRIGVTDPLFPENDGTYEIRGTADGAECHRDGDDGADLFVDIDALGAILLGGRRLWTMARAGRVHGSARAVRRADSFFTWDAAPWCPTVF